MTELPRLPPEKEAILRSLADDPCSLFNLNKIDDLTFVPGSYKGADTLSGVWTRNNSPEEAQFRIVVELGAGSMLSAYGNLEATSDKWLDESHFKNMKYLLIGKVPFEHTSVSEPLATQIMAQPRCLWEIIRKHQGDPSYEEQLRGAELAPRPKLFTEWLTAPKENHFDIKMTSPKVFRLKEEIKRGTAASYFGGGSRAPAETAASSSAPDTASTAASTEAPATSESLPKTMADMPDPQRKFAKLRDRRDLYAVDCQLLAYDKDNVLIPITKYADALLPGKIVIADCCLRLWDMTSPDNKGSKTYQLRVQQLVVFHEPAYDTSGVLGGFSPSVLGLKRSADDIAAPTRRSLVFSGSSTKPSVEDDRDAKRRKKADDKKKEDDKKKAKDDKAKNKDAKGDDSMDTAN